MERASLAWAGKSCLSDHLRDTLHTSKSAAVSSGVFPCKGPACAEVDTRLTVGVWKHRFSWDSAEDKLGHNQRAEAANFAREATAPVSHELRRSNVRVSSDRQPSISSDQVR
jgi:hypothetical protein